MTRLRQKFHQTPLSRTIRRIPGVSALAMLWWKRQQERAIRSSLCSQPQPLVSTSTLVRHVIDLPTVEDLELMDPATISAGISFSERLCAFPTSKFHDLGYQFIYGRAFEHLRNSPVRILEVGIGVNDPSAPSGMHNLHEPGTSLRGWVAYFSDCEVHGADVDRRTLVKSELFETHWVDQLSLSALGNLADEIGAPLDLIIDDGLHTPEANANSLAVLLPLLAPSGLFVIEDIMEEFDYMWTDEIPALLGDAYVVTFFPGSILQPLLSKPRAVLSGLAVVTRVEAV